MALTECPHMNARCPHFRDACRDDDSRECFHVKTATVTAMARLAQLRALTRPGFAAPDADMPQLQGEIRALETFLTTRPTRR